MSTNDNLPPPAPGAPAAKPELPKRFYAEAGIGEVEGGFAVLLDGRAVKTPARNMLAVPSRALAEALAAEWAAQGERIDPATMPLNRLVNSAVDGVVGQAEAVRAEVVKYAGSDLLCYRAEGPPRLVEIQSRHWDPVLGWVHQTFGAHFVLAEGVMFVEQPQKATTAIADAIAGLDPFELAALSTMTTLTGSALLALAVLHGRLDLDAAWTAAHVDEDWNIELWGEDEEAQQRRANRRMEMQAAVTVIGTIRG